MSDLIDRETAIQVACDAVELFPDEWAAIATEMNRIPAIDAEPVRHGRWIPMFVSSGRSSWQCSKCGRRARGKRENLPYCHCGAKMDLEVYDENA